MKRVLLDTNIVLDIILNRQEHIELVNRIFHRLDEPQYSGFVTATTITNIFYIVRKKSGRDAAVKAVEKTLAILGVLPVDYEVLSTALAFQLKDFEDAVQIAAAKAAEMDLIVTRNIKDFPNLGLPVFTPHDFLEYLDKQ